MKKLSIVCFYGALFMATFCWAYNKGNAGLTAFLRSPKKEASQTVPKEEPVRVITVKGATSAATTADVVAKANALLALTTNATQLASLQQTYTTSLARKWSNLPCGSGCRNGLEFSSMNAAQLAAAKAVIVAAEGTTSNEGYDEFIQILTADSVLNKASTSSGTYSSSYYFICFLNAPTTTGAWMLQFGGHHYAANIAFNGGNVVGVTPRFEGVEPKVFTAYNYNGTGTTTTYAPLAQERNTMAYMLSLLSTSQLATAKNSGTFSDVTLAPGETNGGSGTFPTTKAGLAVSTLNSTQQAAVLNAIKPWIQDVDDASYAALLTQYTNELNSVYITYTGNGTSGDSSTFLIANTNYVRLDGANLWIEFVCQSGVVFPTQIHYHSVWRDHTKDYGIDLTSVTLPLKLVDFTATNQGTHRLVAWSTAEETNVGHFEVQLTTDASGTFKSIASVSAKNNGQATSYSYVDAGSSTANVFYYRLKMVDKDGAATYSKTVSVKNSMSIALGLALYPNPASNQLKVSTIQSLSNATVKIINAEGKNVMTISGISGTINNINVSGLASGLYQLSVNNNGNISTAKFSKVAQ